MRKRITRRGINVGTGEVVYEEQHTIEQIRGGRFLLMMVGTEVGKAALDKISPVATHLLIWMLMNERVRFGDGMISIGKTDRDEMRKGGLRMVDMTIWRALKQLCQCKVLIKVTPAHYRLNSLFFNYGKATKWVKARGDDGAGEGGDGDQGAGGLHSSEGGDSEASGSGDEG